MVEEYIWSRYQQEEVKFCEDLDLNVLLRTFEIQGFYYGINKMGEITDLMLSGK